MPRLSVLMPVKNGERYLYSAVASTLRALPSDAQLVVLDDGSTDQTPSVLGSLDCPRLVRHRTTSSKGIAAGLNFLLDNTDSEFVARMDADDIALPWRFKRQLSAIRGADFIFSAIVFMNESGRPLRPDIPGPIGTTAAPLHLATASCMCHPTLFARRSALQENYYRNVAAEDYDLWLRLVAEGLRVARDPLPAIKYRLHSAQVSQSKEWKDWRAADSADDESLSAYRDALSTIGIHDEVTSSTLRFAQGQAGTLPPDEIERISTILHHVDELGRSLSLPERLTLKLRLRKAFQRLRESALPPDA